MTKQINALMNIAWKFAHAVNRYGTADVDTEEDEMQKEFEAVLKDYRNNTLEEAVKVTESFSEECSPELTHADAIRSLKS
jgi:hypothetical protein